MTVTMIKRRRDDVTLHLTGLMHDMDERAWSAAKPTQPKGDPP